MSQQVTTQTEIRNVDILKETLKEMGINYSEIDDHTYAWGTGYNRMSVDVNNGEVKYDHMYGAKLDEFKMTYSKNNVRASILKKGHRIKSQKVLADGRIEIVASY